MSEQQKAVESFGLLVGRSIGWLVGWFGRSDAKISSNENSRVHTHNVNMLCVLSFQLFCIGANSTTEWYMRTVWGRHAIASSQQPTTGKNYTRLLHFFRFYSCFLSLGTIFLQNTKGKHTHIATHIKSFAIFYSSSSWLVFSFCFRPHAPWFRRNETKHFKVGKCLDFSSIECRAMPYQTRPWMLLSAFRVKERKYNFKWYATQRTTLWACVLCVCVCVCVCVHILILFISGVQTKMRKFMHNIKRINIKEIQMKISNGSETKQQQQQNWTKERKSTAKVSNGEAERIHQSQIVCVLRTWKLNQRHTGLA